MQQSSVIETTGVTKIYQGSGLQVRAVDQVDLRVAPGEFIGLVGPSGSGKTTMLAMLATLLQPTEGRLVIDGQELQAMDSRDRTAFRRDKIGFTFQANNLVPYLTAVENVELMLRLNGRADRDGRARAERLLSRLGLDDQLNKLPSQLSGGQQQRVAIARALIHDPSVVLADEPTASLDTERAHQVVSIFADLVHEQRRAGIMVTHDLRMTQYVDKVLQMVDGRIARVITARAEIELLAGTSQFDRLDQTEAAAGRRQTFEPAALPLALVHAAAGGD